MSVINRCPMCSDTDISFNIDIGRLCCNTCKNEFEPEPFSKTIRDINELTGTVVGSGASDIAASAEEVLTFECSSCGAEVVVDTSEALHARCHWCRNTLTLNQQIPNGAVPDKLLPFIVKKDAAQNAINEFVGGRRYFAHPRFKKEFTAENVMGVYLPYMVVDINAKAAMSGQGEILTNEYRLNNLNYYDAERYNVNREFDLIVENITIEADSEKLKHGSSGRTNNIVNAIKPYDTENCLRWNAYYMRGFSSQKRDADVRDLSDLMDIKIQDIARHQALETTKEYDRGVRWDDENLEIIGSQWKAAYLPVWLYSYKHKDVIHYVAVNGRNLKTMGSVPINMARLWLLTLIVGTLGVIAGIAALIILTYIGADEGILAGFIPFGAGPAFFGWIYRKYRNKEARFSHESDANARMENLKGTDDFVQNIEGSRNAETEGRNDCDVDYKGQKSSKGVAFTPKQSTHERFQHKIKK